MARVSKTTTIVATDDALSTTLDGESVILHIESGKYFGFNEVGTEIWELLAEPHSIAEIAQHIAAKYDVAEERCQADIEELVEELLGKELIAVCE